MNIIKIYFDGGCRPTNPGNKYGSWEVLLGDVQMFNANRVEFGWGTNNEAEYEALIAALQWTVDNLYVGGFDPRLYMVKMFTDSLIVCNRIKAMNPNRGERRMKSLAQECLVRLRLFTHWSIQWQKRDHNVARFGH